MAIFPTGRGKYGNYFYFRITRNISGEKERTFRMYNLESYVNSGSLNKLDDTLWFHYIMKPFIMNDLIIILSTFFQSTLHLLRRWMR